MNNEARTKSISALVVHKNDNVATAVRRISKGDTITLEIENKTMIITLSQDIPVGHKFALLDIQKSEPVIKYGEIIGKATAKIFKGGHVHVHNVEGLKGRGDKQ